MSILFGHPTGNPNSHHAALAHFEAGRLEAFCVPWMPTTTELRVLRRIPGLASWSARLQRRSFPPLAKAPRVQGRILEWKRMAKRILGSGLVATEALAYEANDWLMRTMTRECQRPAVTAVHSYEDCSLWQFEEAKRRGKSCIYDMPIGYYPAWQETERALAKQFSDWLPAGGLGSHRFARPEQKRKEMELADLVLVPSTFVQKTITRFTDKNCALAQYGVDITFWQPPAHVKRDRPLRFLYAGQLSIRKGIPVLLEAWRRAELEDAELHLVGSWLLADRIRGKLPKDIRCFSACSRQELLGHYQSADVFVFPSFFEGFALVLLEAMACGLPVLASDATGAPDLLDDATGIVLPAGDVDQWTEALRKVVRHRDRLPAMRKAAQKKACQCTWERYRESVSTAVEPFC
jgi:glycosyltransferase involved in cell wall biosynthesis